MRESTCSAGHERQYYSYNGEKVYTRYYTCGTPIGQGCKEVPQVIPGDNFQPQEDGPMPTSLYSQPEKVELREYQKGPPCASCGTLAKDNPHSCIRALQAKVKELEDENERLKSENKELSVAASWANYD